MIRTLLVDDEEPARERLRRLLKAHAEVNVVDEAADGFEAVEKIQRLRPDLVFLDVQMPGRTGIEVAASIQPPRPDIVFCTAFDQYAIDAFELHAVDYLLKPVNRNRLARSVERARTNLGNRRANNEDLTMAGEVQRRLYPSQAQLLSHFEYSGACKPARTVGGDYFDFIGLGAGRLAVALGDVSGKGVQAALLMASLQGRVQSLAPGAGGDLGGFVGRLNRRIWESTSDSRYATFFYSVLDDARRQVGFVNAGHPAPLLFRGVGEPPVRLSQGGTALGFFPDSRYSHQLLNLQPGDTILMFTDGVLEAVDGRGEEFGEERLLRLAGERLDESAAGLQASVLEAVEKFSAGTSQTDDITVVVVRCRESS